MQESFLHAVWRYSLYRPEGLSTTEGQPVTIIQSGTYNTNAGPDFLEAKVKVGSTTLVGHIELHVKSSDWRKHEHDGDAAYNNVILHVVYEDDAKDATTHIPTLCIKQSIPDSVLGQYHRLIQNNDKLPCAASLSDVRDITKESWLSRMLAERWEQKLAGWQDVLEDSQGDWRELLYQRLATNFGFKVNADAFQELARSLPLNILAKHGNNLLQIEALLFGQSGMLDDTFEDEYPKSLKKEYNFLKKKYRLTPLESTRWKFMRMRPANFPTVRIAQFAALIFSSVHLFSQIIEKSDTKEVAALFDVAASEYWDNHYRFDEESKVKRKKKLGESSVQNIIINTVAPIKFLYASQQAADKLKDDALTLIDNLPAEQNRIIDIWDAHNWKPVNAAQSQAQIQLYNNYCINKRCTECAIGLSILKS